LVIARKKIIFGIHGRHISAFSPHIQNRGTLLMQNNARLQQGLVFRCSKTTTSEFLIGLRVVPNEHVWAELDHRRGPQRDNVSDGGRLNLLLELI